eukprot:6190932-Pleurochrysis_carterae.AAC.3
MSAEDRRAVDSTGKCMRTRGCAVCQHSQPPRCGRLREVAALAVDQREARVRLVGVGVVRGAAAGVCGRGDARKPSRVGAGRHDDLARIQLELERLKHLRDAAQGHCRLTLSKKKADDCRSGLKGFTA